MIARLLLLLLLVAANVGYFAWTRDWLSSWGFASAGTGEPQRLAQQIRPETLRILSTGGNGDAVPASPPAAPAAQPAASAVVVPPDADVPAPLPAPEAPAAAASSP